MVLKYRPKTKLEKFCHEIYLRLVENFPQSFYVGGMVRDLLIGRTVKDADLATQALPAQVESLFNGQGLALDMENSRFGTVITRQKDLFVEITTFRAETYNQSRYPEIRFVDSMKADSLRRDFTVNSLYFSPKSTKIYDFHKGLKDLKGRVIRFIGEPEDRMEQDPLRIIRAMRFALDLDFRMEKKTFRAVKKYFNLTQKLSKSRIEKELGKVRSVKNKKIIISVLDNPQELDKYFSLS